MGIDWLIVIHRHKKYYPLPKKGEWGNELWAIWKILKDIEDGEGISFINSESENYNRLIESEEWKDITDELESTDYEYRLYDVQSLSSGTASAMYKAMISFERFEKSRDEQMSCG